MKAPAAPAVRAVNVLREQDIAHGNRYERTKGGRKKKRYYTGAAAAVAVSLCAASFYRLRGKWDGIMSFYKALDGTAVDGDESMCLEAVAATSHAAAFGVNLLDVEDLVQNRLNFV